VENYNVENYFLDEPTPPLCGAIPPDSNYIPSPGDMVAALVGHGKRFSI